MKIMVSACLMGANCKYNGGNNLSEKLVSYTIGHEVFLVCPEVMGGLPVPRIPCEIVDGVVINREGVSCDEAYRKGAQKSLDIALKEQMDVVILQSRSPSCGIGKIYDGTFSKTLKDGNGVFAEMLIENGFKVVDIEFFEKDIDTVKYDEDMNRITQYGTDESCKLDESGNIVGTIDGTNTV